VTGGIPEGCNAISGSSRAYPPHSTRWPCSGILLF